MKKLLHIGQLNGPSFVIGSERITLRKCEAAKALGISERTLHNLLKSGQIRSSKLDRAVLIPIAELEAFIERHSQTGGQHECN